MVRRCVLLPVPDQLQPEKQAAAFHEQGAVEALLEMLRVFKLDEVFLRQAVKTLIPLCEQDGESFARSVVLLSCTAMHVILDDRSTFFRGSVHILVFKTTFVSRFPRVLNELYILEFWDHLMLPFERVVRHAVQQVATGVRERLHDTVLLSCNIVCKRC